MPDGVHQTELDFMSTPLVSIVIPVYNGSDFLREAIDSALAQTYSNIEVIVINDGSHDEGRTREIALSYGNRITYLEKENGGVATALNAGINASSGKYISWLSHDDAYDPSKLEVQVPLMERLESEGRKVLLYSSFLLMNDRSVIYKKFDMPDVIPNRFYEALLANMVFLGPFKRRPFSVHGCTLLLPRQAFDEFGLFDPGLPTTQDFDLWFRMIASYDFIRSDGYLVRSRVHKGQGTIRLRKDRIGEVEDLYLNAFRLYKKGSERYDLDLPRVMLALKSKRRMKAYFAARSELKRQGMSMRGRTYLLIAILTTKTGQKTMELVRYGWRRLRSVLKRTNNAPSVIDK